MADGKFAFENYGGTYQLRIREAKDLEALAKLDEPFWVAMSAPAAHLRCDPALLRRMDVDGSGRISSGEIREAARWLLHVLKDRQGVTDQADALNPEAIDTSHEEGQRLAQSARRVLKNLGRGERSPLTLADVRNRQAIFARGLENGDGVVPLEALGDDALRGFAEAVVTAEGAVDDVNGMPGVDKSTLSAFLEHARALIAWEASGQTEPVLPFGPDTPGLHGLLTELKPAIDAYFRVCEVTALNDTLQRETEPAPCPASVFEDEASADEYLAAAPLARPTPDCVLPLLKGVNPYYAAGLRALMERVLKPALGDALTGDALSPAQWDEVVGKFSAYEEWLAAKSGGQVEALGLERLQGYVDSGLPEQLATMIQADRSAGAELGQLDDLEYLILLQHTLIDLCNNFVSFPHLYDPEARAMFEAGRVVMDGQIFNMNFLVDDVAAHSAAAERSGIYLLYSEVTGGTGDTPFNIVTPITTGRIGKLGTGKRGCCSTGTGSSGIRGWSESSPTP